MEQKAVHRPQGSIAFPHNRTRATVTTSIAVPAREALSLLSRDEFVLVNTILHAHLHGMQYLHEDYIRQLLTGLGMR